MSDFDAVSKRIEDELRGRGMENSSLICNKLAEYYALQYQSSSQKEREQLIEQLKLYESRRGLSKPFDWVFSLMTCCVKDEYIDGIELKWIDIKTHIGSVKGSLNQDGKLLVENDQENMKLKGLIPPGEDEFRPLLGALKNPDQTLTVLEPNCCRGGWVYEGKEHSGGAWITPPLVFKRKPDNKLS